MVVPNINQSELEDRITKKIRCLHRNYKKQEENNKKPGFSDALKAIIIAFFSTSSSLLSHYDCMINLKNNKLDSSDKTYNSSSSDKKYSP